MRKMTKDVYAGRKKQRTKKKKLASGGFFPLRLCSGRKGRSCLADVEQYA